MFRKYGTLKILETPKNCEYKESEIIFSLKNEAQRFDLNPQKIQYLWFEYTSTILYEDFFFGDLNKFQRVFADIYCHKVNFCMGLLSRVQVLVYFAWIYFRRW